MLIDITLPITPQMLVVAWENTAKSLVGHLGTHFDVMDKDFPLSYTARQAVVFDVSFVKDRDICASDIDLDQVKEDMFVAFYTGFIEKIPYGTPAYFKEHPQLSTDLIEALLRKNISIIGIDCAGIRRASEHVPTDQHCADQGVFVIENLYNLNAVISVSKHFLAQTFPLRISDITGIPCRVLAKLD